MQVAKPKPAAVKEAPLMVPCTGFDTSEDEHNHHVAALYSDSLCEWQYMGCKMPDQSFTITPTSGGNCIVQAVAPQNSGVSHLCLPFTLFPFMGRLVNESRMMALFRMIIPTACQIILTVRMMGSYSVKKSKKYDKGQC
jgi:hypothetical protein